MTEEERWVKEIFIEDKKIEKAVQAQADNKNLVVEDGRRLLYAYQVRSYAGREPKGEPERKGYKTDVLEHFQ